MKKKDYKVLYRKIRKYVNFKYDLRKKLSAGQKAAISRAYEKMRYVLRTNDLTTVRRLRGETDRQFKIRINKIARSANVEIIQGNKLLIRQLPKGTHYRFSKGKAEVISAGHQRVYEFDHVHIDIDDTEEDIYYKVKNCINRHPGAYSVNILARLKSFQCADADFAAELLTQQLVKTLFTYVIDEDNSNYNITLRFFYKPDEQLKREAAEREKQEKIRHEKQKKNRRYRRGN